MLQTCRLILREFRDEDASVLYEFMRDQAAMRYTYVAPTLEHCARRLHAFESLRASHGFAPWVALNSAADIVGWGGLGIDPDDPHWGLEVIYALHPAFWGVGYATELVRFSTAYAFEQLSALQVAAFAMPQNAASVRVLTKCGFRFVGYERTLLRNHYLAVAAQPGSTDHSKR